MLVFKIHRAFFTINKKKADNEDFPVETPARDLSRHRTREAVHVKAVLRSWGGVSVVEHAPSVFKALGSISGIAKGGRAFLGFL